MQTILSRLNNYVDFLKNFNDPFGAGIHLHATLIIFHWIVAYLIIKGLTRKAQGRIGQTIYNFGGVVSLVIAYLITILLIRIKNN